MDVRVFARKDRVRTDADKLEEKRVLHRICTKFKEKYARIREERSIRMEELLLGQKLPVDIVHVETGEVVVAQEKKVTRAMLERLDALDFKNIEIGQCPMRIEIRQIVMD